MIAFSFYALFVCFRFVVWCLLAGVFVCSGLTSVEFVCFDYCFLDVFGLFVYSVIDLGCLVCYFAFTVLIVRFLKFSFVLLYY